MYPDTIAKTPALITGNAHDAGFNQDFIVGWCQKLENEMVQFLKVWRDWPEARLLLWGVPLEFLWEIAQFPLYTIWYEHGWDYILYSLIHCTLGDALILLVSYEVVALLWRRRAWVETHVWSGGTLFTLLGAGYTIYSEIYNTRINAAWSYTEYMPIVPGIEIGLAPLLQWLLIPPLLLRLMRLMPGQRYTHK